MHVRSAFKHNILRREPLKKVMVLRVLPQHLTVMGALALSLFLLTFMAVYPERAHAQEEDYRTGELVVRLDPGVTITRFLNLYPTLERLDGGLPHNLASRNIYLLEAPASTNVRSFAQNL